MPGMMTVPSLLEIERDFLAGNMRAAIKQLQELDPQAGYIERKKVIVVVALLVGALQAVEHERPLPVDTTAEELAAARTLAAVIRAAFESPVTRYRGEYFLVVRDRYLCEANLYTLTVRDSLDPPGKVFTVTRTKEVGQHD